MINMKIIFLDNDGVICLGNNYGSRFKKQRKYFKGNPRDGFDDEGPVEVRFDNFDRKAIKTLNSILLETNAEIVVSSDWRHIANLEELGEYYTAQGISKKPIGVTKKYQDCDDDTNSVYWPFKEERCIEIHQWLKDHTEITHWVAIDDMQLGRNDDERTWGLRNFVHTPKGMEGIKQCGRKEKIIKFLL